MKTLERRAHAGRRALKMGLGVAAAGVTVATLAPAASAYSYDHDLPVCEGAHWRTGHVQGLTGGQSAGETATWEDPVCGSSRQLLVRFKYKAPGGAIKQWPAAGSNFYGSTNTGGVQAPPIPEQGSAILESCHAINKGGWYHASIGLNGNYVDGSCSF